MCFVTTISGLVCFTAKSVSYDTTTGADLDKALVVAAAWQPAVNDYAKGAVALEGGIITEGANNLHRMNVLFPVDGTIDLMRGGFELRNELHIGSGANILGGYVGRDGSGRIMGQGNVVVLDDDMTLTAGALIFTGTAGATLDGQNHTLTLGTGVLADDGSIIVDTHGSTVMISNLTIRGLAANKLRCLDGTGTFTFKNVCLLQDANYSFTVGHFDVLEDLTLRGSNTNFTYKSSKQSKICSWGMLVLDTGVTFSYDPVSNNRGLLAFADASSALLMRGASLASTRTGLQLTKGHLILENKNYFRNDGAMSASQGISIGNGTASDDIKVSFFPGASINLLSGELVNNNVN